MDVAICYTQNASIYGTCALFLLFFRSLDMDHPADQPLRFEPYLRPLVWGNRRIARFLGKNLPPGDQIGESWEVSNHALHQSKLATAFGFGQSMRQLMDEHRRAILGAATDRYDGFPWLIKLLDAADWLSVQVHPDENAVKRLLPGERAKTEAWYVLDAEPSSRIYAGLLRGFGPGEVRQAIANGSVDKCLHSFTPRAGDFVYLPAGTVHAVGGGVLLLEIQQTSDATFRLFDWNRRDAKGQARQLHVEEGLASIHWEQGPINPIRGAAGRLVSCPYFDAEHFAWTSTSQMGGTGRLQAFFVASGQGRFENGEYVMAGDVWVLPAQMTPMSLQPIEGLRGLLFTLPE